MNYIIIGLIIVALAVEATSQELPIHFKTCPRHLPNFTECVSSAAVDAIVSLAQGLKSFNILPLEPLAVDGLSVGKTGGAVSIKQSYKNIKLYGLTKGLKIKYEPIAPNLHVLRSTSYNDQVDFVADYTLNGRILIVPIRGKGLANVTMIGLQSNNAMHCETYEKNGETYLRVTKYEIHFMPEKVLLNFMNLPNSGSVLGNKEMNRLLNANSKLIFEETQNAFEHKFGSVFTNLANEVFSRIPMSKIFPK